MVFVDDLTCDARWKALNPEFTNPLGSFVRTDERLSLLLLFLSLSRDCFEPQKPAKSFKRATSHGTPKDPHDLTQCLGV